MGKRGPDPKYLGVACPNPECKMFNIRGEGNVVSKGQRTLSSGDVVRVFRCNLCGKSFTNRSGTMYQRTRYPKGIVDEAVRRVRQNHEPVAKVAEDMGIVRSTLYRWLDPNRDRNGQQADADRAEMLARLISCLICLKEGREPEDDLWTIAESLGIRITPDDERCSVREVCFTRTLRRQGSSRTSWLWQSGRTWRRLGATRSFLSGMS